jgi:hypothetical protein
MDTPTEGYGRVGSRWSGGRNNGFLRPCKFCGERIYMLQRFDGRWVPVESWVAGNVEPGVFRSHRCRAH